MNIGEVCNREVIVTPPDTSIVETARLMRRHHVGDLVVCESRGEDNHPVGVITDRDLVLEILAEGVSLDAVAVKDVMSPTLHTLADDEDLWTALERMRGEGVRRMPVVDAAGALVGILTLDDLLELLAEAASDLVKLVRREISQEQRKRP